ncbi:MAG: YqgE/AlgH family protein [Flavobacteriaceae bacterium]|jgi:putative transcriptional regulator|tara:strand:- start:1168 stop:1698 length:531 start_codon:yes stop_codon:yes gene_type:complete
MVGKLLISHPSLLGDPSFGRSVILLVEHNDQNSLGFVVNQPTNYSLNELIPELNIDLPIYRGGPVDNDRLFYVHTLKDLPNAQAIENKIFWGGELEALQNQIIEKKIAPDQLRFFLGYSGWGQGQLLNEFNEKSWLLIKNNYNIFENEDQLWGNIMRDLGGEYALYATAPKHPGLN